MQDVTKGLLNFQVSLTWGTVHIATYNRKELLYRCVLKNLEQTYTQDILIIDNNSTDGTYEFLVSRGVLNNCHVKYIRNEKNECGAGGFFRGLEYVFSHDYDSAWLMDDDTW